MTEGQKPYGRYLDLVEEVRRLRGLLMTVESITQQLVTDITRLQHRIARHIELQVGRSDRNPGE